MFNAVARSSVAAARRALSTSTIARDSPKLWGGRFSRDTDTSILDWTESISIDSKMVVQDTWGSMAHVAMLGRQGVIPAADAGKILGGLLKLQDTYIAGEWKLQQAKEDVHLNVEGKLIETLGMEVAGKMHTTRSRNDQVILDSRMYTRTRLIEVREKVVKAVEAFLARAQNYTETVMVGYTHVQHAQPISVAYWLSHYSAVLLRDLERLKRSFDVTDLNPLGSGALCTTSFPIDRQLTTDLLGFQQIMEHGMDATSSRDFMLEVVSNNAILMSTLSRLAEEVVLWTSYEFRTLSLDDGFAMGSSMMPQKKNPGALELLRGRMGRMSGLVQAGMTMLKGLPSGYNRDFHEEKEVLWASLDLISSAVQVIPPLINSTKINTDRMAQLADGNFANATELANFLVQKNVPFRKAHHVVGSLVGELHRAGENFSNFEKSYKHIKAAVPEATEDEIRKVLDPKSVMMSYNVFGGTGPIAMKATLARQAASLEKHKKALKADSDRLDTAYTAARSIAAEGPSVKTRSDLEKLVAKYNPVQSHA